ncbi:uncharacterized protein LOC131148639 [Malania oleifera]|uniref:uncharacterized protein LOC131148639 n=1 Tax=Malania oleifera TaxID=397392 RepID=UPI0025AE9307|nr:uncharacterized protein LOC131148639 [Malania oleifera]
MSKGDDDARQYRCLKKYEEIVKQVLLIDELTDSMDLASKMSKRPKNSKGGSSSRSGVEGGGGGGAAESEEQQQQGGDGNNKVFVDTITRFLNDLRSSPTHDHHHSSSTTTTESHK